MNHFRLDEMVRGWFVGDFSPTAFSTTDVEVGIKQYAQGDCEDAHVHRVATELTVVISGRVQMCGQVWEAGDIVVLAPGDATDFRAIEQACTVVVKLPSVQGDKYPVEGE